MASLRAGLPSCLLGRALHQHSAMRPLPRALGGVRPGTCTALKLLDIRIL